jgi:hypothetical protein
MGLPPRGGGFASMPHSSATWQRALVSGATASAASTAVLAVAGRVQNGRAAAPTNATSHWLWGESATYVDRPTLRHTLVGYAIHHAASVFWALFYEQRRRRGETAGKVVADAALVAGLACLVDYTITPPRFTPGFEKRLSKPALAAVYAAFGAGLAAATIWRRG